MVEWDHPRRLHLPKGISRHEVRFFGYDTGIYAVKEISARTARHEFEILRRLEDIEAPAAVPVGIVERPWLDEAADPVQAYCDFLHHRYAISTSLGRDVPNDEAFADWVRRGQPGYPI